MFVTIMIVSHVNSLVSSDAVAVTMGAFGQGSGPVLLNSLQCHGNETQLLECPGAVFLTTSPCQHSQDVGVVCNERPCMFVMSGLSLVIITTKF